MERSRRSRAVLLGVALSLGILVAGAAPAFAHGSVTPGVVSVAQTLGAHELTVTMYPPTSGPGPLPIRIVAHGRAAGSPLLVSTVPAAGPGPGGPASQAVVTPGTGPGAAAMLQIDRPGPWEVVLVDHTDVARIPLSVPAAPPTPMWVWVLRAGLVAAVVGAIGAAAAGRRRPRAALGVGAVALAGVVTTAVTSLLSTSIPVSDPAAVTPLPTLTTHDTMGMSGMSGMTTSGSMTPGASASSGAVVVTTSVLQPGADGLTELALGLTDGSTGAPVDDLVVHDQALVHLAVIGPAGALWHVHPVRVGPGRYSVRLPLVNAGRYGVFAEMERAGGGHQVTRSAFTVDAAPAVVATGPAPMVAAPGGPGSREVAGMRIDATVTAARPGRDSRVELVFSEAGQPVRNLQAWLGMGAHLMVLGPGAGGADPDPTDPATLFAHIHDMDPAAPSGYGPIIGFTYAFPAAGRYQLWAQVQRDWRLITVPITVEIPAIAPASSGN